VAFVSVSCRGLFLREASTYTITGKCRTPLMYSWGARLILLIAFQASSFPMQMRSAAISLCGHCYSKIIMLSIYCALWQILTGTNYWLNFPWSGLFGWLHVCAVLTYLWIANLGASLCFAKAIIVTYKWLHWNSVVRFLFHLPLFHCRLNDPDDLAEMKIDKLFGLCVCSSTKVVIWNSGFLRVASYA